MISLAPFSEWSIIITALELQAF